MNLSRQIGVDFAFPTRTLDIETMPTAARGAAPGAYFQPAEARGR